MGEKPLSKAFRSLEERERKAREQQEYMKCGGIKCPACGSIRIEAGKREPNGKEFYVEVTCLACGAGWWDLYKLFGFAWIGERRRT